MNNSFDHLFIYYFYQDTGYSGYSGKPDRLRPILYFAERNVFFNPTFLIMGAILDSKPYFYISSVCRPYAMFTYIHVHYIRTFVESSWNDVSLNQLKIEHNWCPGFSTWIHIQAFIYFIFFFNSKIRL